MRSIRSNVVIASPIGEGSVALRTTDGLLHPTIDEISRVAYELYEQRGCQDGHDVEDWLIAEQQLRRHFA